MSIYYGTFNHEISTYKSPIFWDYAELGTTTFNVPFKVYEMSLMAILALYLSKYKKHLLSGSFQSLIALILIT